MVTTREFISVAAWHFLSNDDLRARYLAADRDERHAMLHEILRLEPVVGELYRRTTAELTIDLPDGPTTIPADELIELDIYAANVDPEVVGSPEDVVWPSRDLPKGVQAAGMSFGDGNHRCPGAYIAIEESDIFLTNLLAIEKPSRRTATDPHQECTGQGLRTARLHPLRRLGRPKRSGRERSESQPRTEPPTRRARLACVARTPQAERMTPGLAHAIGGVSRQAKDADASEASRIAWAIEDLNLGPHPYQGCALTA